LPREELQVRTDAEATGKYRSAARMIFPSAGGEGGLTTVGAPIFPDGNRRVENRR